MRILAVMMPVIFLSSCETSSISEQNFDFEEKAWVLSDKPKFDFDIEDSKVNYNLYYTVRNSLDFPFSRLFVTYSLQDSLKNELSKELVSVYLFDEKTGEPQGASSIGDLYDHRFSILDNYHFDKPGRYSITLEQFNRRDTLEGILAVGIQVEKVQNQD